MDKSGWTFYDFVELSGRNPFLEWKEGLPEEASAFIDARILVMAGLARWSEKWASKYRTTEKIIELRISFDRVEYRPLGAYMPGHSFILLAGATERDGRLPTSIVDAAVRRQQQAETEPQHVRPHRLN
jgi:hypothetical protein